MVDDRSGDISRPSVDEIVRKYLARFKDEEPRLGQLNELISSTQPNEYFSRGYQLAHITASGIVVSRSTHKVLVLFHKRYNVMLQPGGHLRPEDTTLLEAAKSRVVHETGLSSLEHVAYHFNELVPIDIDTHHTPESTERNEPEHYHHDFRYLFLTNDSEDVVQIDRSRFESFKWVDVNELRRLQTFSQLVGKVQEALSAEFRAKLFFDRIIERWEPAQRVSTIIIQHFMPDAMPYFRTLARVSDVRMLIAKPKSIHDSVEHILQQDFNVLKANRDEIASGSIIQNELRNSDHPVVLFDIGGYFAPLAKNLLPELRQKLLGIIEDTENGYRRYIEQGDLPVAVYSVARSPLKDNEDFLVGQSVLFSADAVLRKVGKLIQYLTCTVIGHGKIGGSIAYHLLLRGVKPNVLDVDPIKRLEAFNRLCHIPERKWAIKNSDIIFCATGQHALNIHDFRRLKPGCIVFSVTSADDEIDLSHVLEEYHSEDVDRHIAKYSSFSNYFYLVNEGNAVNFLHNAALGDFIHLVRAEMVVAMYALTVGCVGPGLHELEPDTRQEIAQIWLDTIVDQRAGKAGL